MKEFFTADVIRDAQKLKSIQNSLYSASKKGLDDVIEKICDNIEEYSMTHIDRRRITVPAKFEKDEAYYIIDYFSKLGYYAGRDRFFNTIVIDWGDPTWLAYLKTKCAKIVDTLIVRES